MPTKPGKEEKRNFRKPLLAAFLWSWTFWLFFYLSGKTGPSYRYNILYLLGLFGPSLSAFYFSYRENGREGVRSLTNGLLSVFQPFWWYFFATFGMIMISYFSLLVQNNFESAQVDLSAMDNVRNLLIALLVIFIFAPFGQEFMWRGFLQTSLLRKYSFFTSTVIIGIIWALWQLPLFFIDGTLMNHYMHHSAFILVLHPLALIGLTGLFSLLYMNTSGSIFMAILFHTFINWSFQTFKPNDTFTGFLTTYGIILILWLGIVFTNREEWFRIPESS